MAYFIHEDGSQSGPFTIEELKQRRILPSTPVWAEGFAEWTTASHLKELQGVISRAPPPFHQPGANTRPGGSFQQPAKTGSGFWNFLRLVAAAILIVFIALFLIRQFYHPPGSIYSSMSGPTVDLEHAYPTNYLATGGTWRSNFWQTEEEISGTITNRAIHTNYKDIRIRVSYYSQTKTVIGTQDYVIYEYVPYGSTQAFSIKLSKPPGVANLGWVAIGATYY
jgi:hypothetical protein